MKLYVAIILSFIVSVLFIMFTLLMNAEELNEERIEKLKLSQLQKVCKKEYTRQRKLYVPKRSIVLAQQEINTILKKNPILFSNNSFSLESNSTLDNELSQTKHTLTKLVAILNNIREESILSITAYTDKTGSAKGNLLLSQQRADEIKEYLFKRTSLVLIVAIGYGEALPKTTRRIEINLKRI